jgi:hypothetical protein
MRKGVLLADIWHDRLPAISKPQSIANPEASTMLHFGAISGK